MARKTATTKNPVELKKIGEENRQIYIKWRSIPKMLRLLPDDELKKMGFDTDDPVFMKMVRIRTKKEFCEEFGVNNQMPSKWERDPNTVQEINAESQNRYVMKFKHDIDFSFTQKVIRHGDANRMKLWKQLYEGWSERTENVNVNMNMTPADLVRDIEARNAKLREQT